MMLVYGETSNDGMNGRKNMGALIVIGAIIVLVIW